MANSKIYLGSTNIGSLFQGADDISIYLGENKVYPLAEPKWVATYSDSHTESAQCDSSSAIESGEIDTSNLVSVEIGDCVTSIGDSAFENCSSLTSITIPDSVTTIGGAFAYCTSLSSVTIGSGVTSIGDSAFYRCSGLTSVTVEAVDPPQLESDVFKETNNCPIYVPCESLNAYKSAPYWSDYADRIQAIPNSCPKFYATYSGGETYRLECDGNTTLTTGNTKPTGYEYSAMTEAIIGDCVTEIDDHAFYDFSGLTSVSIPDSVTTIGVAPFQNCTSLTSVTIPSGVTSIDYQAFVQCTSLNSITCLATTPPTLGIRVFNTGNSCPIYVPSASVNAYKSATNWSNYASRIQAIP